MEINYALNEDSIIPYGPTRNLHEMPPLNTVQGLDVVPKKISNISESHVNPVVQNNHVIINIPHNQLNQHHNVIKDTSTTLQQAYNKELVYICIGVCVVIMCGGCMLCMGVIGGTAAGISCIVLKK